MVSMHGTMGPKSVTCKTIDPTSIWDVALQVIISMLKEHIFNAEIVHINGKILPPSGRAICFAAASRRKNPGAHYELWRSYGYDGIMWPYVSRPYHTDYVGHMYRYYTWCTRGTWLQYYYCIIVVVPNKQSINQSSKQTSPVLPHPRRRPISGRFRSVTQLVKQMWQLLPE